MSQLWVLRGSWLMPWTRMHQPRCSSVDRFLTHLFVSRSLRVVFAVAFLLFSWKPSAQKSNNWMVHLKRSQTCVLQLLYVNNWNFKKIISRTSIDLSTRLYVDLIYCHNTYQSEAWADGLHMIQETAPLHETKLWKCCDQVRHKNESVLRLNCRHGYVGNVRATSKR